MGSCENSKSSALSHTTETMNTAENLELLSLCCNRGSGFLGIPGGLILVWLCNFMFAFERDRWCLGDSKDMQVT